MFNYKLLKEIDRKLNIIIRLIVREGEIQMALIDDVLERVAAETIESNTTALADAVVTNTPA